MYQHTLSLFEKNLLDINNDKSIPEHVLEYFYEWKRENGTIPAGISYIQEEGWYIISPSKIDNIIIKFFKK